MKTQEQIIESLEQLIEALNTGNKYFFESHDGYSFYKNKQALLDEGIVEENKTIEEYLISVELEYLVQDLKSEL